MKQLLVVFGILLCMAQTSYAGDIKIDVSASYVEAVDGVTLRIRNVTVIGEQDKYWADLQWDPSALVFVPVNVGIDNTPPPKTLKASVDLPDGIMEITINTDPLNSRLLLAVTATQGSPLFSTDWLTFSQGDRNFTLTLSPSTAVSETALFHSDDMWGVQEQLMTGQTVSGIIDSIPTWFNFGNPMTLNYAGLDFHSR